MRSPEVAFALLRFQLDAEALAGRLGVYQDRVRTHHLRDAGHGTRYYCSYCLPQAQQAGEWAESPEAGSIADALLNLADALRQRAAEVFFSEN